MRIIVKLLGALCALVLTGFVGHVVLPRISLDGNHGLSAEAAAAARAATPVSADLTMQTAPAGATRP